MLPSQSGNRNTVDIHDRQNRKKMSFLSADEGRNLLEQ
jgi:hypothetical protein